MSDKIEETTKNEDEVPENNRRCPICGTIILIEENGYCTTCQHLEE